LLVAVLGAGCKVDTTASIRLTDDGSGTISVKVRFDQEAVQVVERTGEGKLEDRIELSDLRGDGWRLGPWVRTKAGGASITLTHSFTNGAELRDIVNALNGNNGLLRDVHVSRTRNIVERRDGLSAVADLRKLRSGVRDDKELASRLRAAGVDVDAVDYILGEQLQQAFTLHVALTVPHEKTRTFTVNAGDVENVNLSSTKFQTNRFATLMIGAMLVFLALLLYLSASISARRRHARELEFAAVRARRGAREPLM
jgi:hypothetical protein